MSARRLSCGRREHVPPAGPGKGMSSRIFNTVEGKRLGGVQSFGGRVKVGQIANYIVDMVERNVPFRNPWRASWRARVRAGRCANAPRLRDLRHANRRFRLSRKSGLAGPEKPQRIFGRLRCAKGFAGAGFAAAQAVESPFARARHDVRLGRPAQFRTSGWHLPVGDSPLSSVLDPSGKVRGMRQSLCGRCVLHALDFGLPSGLDGGGPRLARRRHHHPRVVAGSGGIAGRRNRRPLGTSRSPC